MRLMFACLTHGLSVMPNICPRWTGSALVQLVDCRLFGAKPLREIIMIGTLRTNQWNSSRNTNFSIHKNAFENVVYKLADILSQPWCVKQQTTSFTNKVNMLQVGVMDVSYHIRVHMWHVAREPLMGLPSWGLDLWSRPCDTFDDSTLIDEIYGCSIFKCVPVIYLEERHQDISQKWLPDWHALLESIGPAHNFTTSVDTYVPQCGDSTFHHKWNFV